MVVEVAKGDSDSDVRALGVAGELYFLACANDGKKDGETLSGGPWGNGAYGGDRLNDADRAEAVVCLVGFVQSCVGGVHGSANGPKGSKEVFESGAGIWTRLEAVVAVWFGPVERYAVVWVAHLIVNEQLQPTGTGEGVGGTPRLRFSK